MNSVVAKVPTQSSAKPTQACEKTTTSVVVPVLNEEQTLPLLLAGLARLPVLEVIFVDGGSSDSSAALIAQSGFRLISSAPGRARQMNAGAEQARGDLLLFLHADTQLPAQAIEQISQVMQYQKRMWGRFDVTISGGLAALRVVAFMMNWRSRLTGIATGDQCIFVRRACFQSIGGFPNIALMEDIALSKKLKRLSAPVCLRGPVVTSGRRWQSRGVVKTIVLMWWLRAAYWLGVSPNRLRRWYR